MSFKKKLQAELVNIEFTDFQKAVLKRQIKQAIGKDSRKTFSERLAAFWNGYTEISVSVLACAAGMMLFGFGAVCAHVFVVDEVTAALLLKTSVDLLEYPISEGVVVL